MLWNNGTDDIDPSPEAEERRTNEIPKRNEPDPNRALVEIEIEMEIEIEIEPKRRNETTTTITTTTTTTNDDDARDRCTVPKVEVAFNGEKNAGFDPGRSFEWKTLAAVLVPVPVPVGASTTMTMFLRSVATALLRDRERGITHRRFPSSWPGVLPPVCLRPW